jgi:hypothetical protein
VYWLLCVVVLQAAGVAQHLRAGSTPCHNLRMSGDHDGDHPPLDLTLQHILSTRAFMPGCFQVASYVPRARLGDQVFHAPLWFWGLACEVFNACTEHWLKGCHSTQLPLDLSAGAKDVPKLRPAVYCMQAVL